MAPLTFWADSYTMAQKQVEMNLLTDYFDSNRSDNFEIRKKLTKSNSRNLSPPFAQTVEGRLKFTAVSHVMRHCGDCPGLQLTGSSWHTEVGREESKNQSPWLP